MKKCTKKLRKTVLAELRERIKIFIALNCWISLNNLTSLNTINYFINEHWDYEEVLLEFKSLCDKYTEKNLIKVIINILNSYNVLNKLLIVIADNIFNNTTLCTELIILL